MRVASIVAGLSAVVVACGCASTSDAGGASHPTSTTKPAVACAERFVQANGYTDLPPDPSTPVIEPYDFVMDDEGPRAPAVYSARHGTLKRFAMMVCGSMSSVGKGRPDRLTSPLGGSERSEHGGTFHVLAIR